MAKKPFLIMLIALLVTFGFSAVITMYRPGSVKTVDLTKFPTTLGEWQGRVLVIDKGVIDLLSPDAIFDAIYTNKIGTEIELFFSYINSDNKRGGIHSPRNCIPGSGWTILNSTEHQIKIGNASIPATRLKVRFRQENRVIDYWYITRKGETSNDYQLKLYTMLSAVSLTPTDVAFVRFVAPDDPVSLEMLDTFENQIGQEVYNLLPFPSPEKR
jgi:EpsI family protein